jgi:hypothetical protein
MRRIVHLFIAIAACSWADFALGQSKDAAYYCVAEFAGGLLYDATAKKWQGASFRADNKFVMRMKYVGSRIEQSGSSDWSITEYMVTITEAGKAYASPCSDAGSYEAKPVLSSNSWIVCNSSLTDYQFNLKTNRFLSVYAQGYAGGDDNNKNTPSVSGGTCTKID